MVCYTSSRKKTECAIDEIGSCDTAVRNGREPPITHLGLVIRRAFARQDYLLGRGHSLGGMESQCRLAGDAGDLLRQGLCAGGTDEASDAGGPIKVSPAHATEVKLTLGDGRMLCGVHGRKSGALG